MGATKRIKGKCEDLVHRASLATIFPAQLLDFRLIWMTAIICAVSTIQSSGIAALPIVVREHWPRIWKLALFKFQLPPHFHLSGPVYSIVGFQWKREVHALVHYP
jgi:hypothetical protein